MKGNGMKVLIPVDIPGMKPSHQNPFIPELVFSLISNNCIVDTGLLNLNKSRNDWDVINFQWPE